jgi:SAM-dependent methyltransferase
VFSAPDRFHLRQKMYELTRCPSCSLVYLQNPPKPDELTYHYGTDYHKAVTTAGEVNSSSRWRHPRERVLKMGRRGALLDIGCSSGGFLRTLRGNGWELFGVEASQMEGEKAKANSGAQVFVGDVLDAPFLPSSFDIITCFHVLEHVYRLKDLLWKLGEWLKPGGIVYLHVPNIEALEARVFRSYWYGLELPRHLYHFSPDSLRRLFALGDFDEILLCTLSHSHVEASIRYVLDDALMNLGISRTPLAGSAGRPNIAWRIIRKALRLSLLEPFGYLAAAVGRGAGIEAAFRKRVSGGGHGNARGV